MTFHAHVAITMAAQRLETMQRYLFCCAPMEFFVSAAVVCANWDYSVIRVFLIQLVQRDRVPLDLDEVDQMLRNACH
jgi:hypothetical protein